MAVLESYVVIIVLLMIMMSMNHGSGSLSDSIEGKVLPFLNIFRQEDQAELSFIGLLQISKQLVCASFVLYSFIMILTALVQYVDVHKDEQLSIKGQTCLLAYFACHMIARITATVAIFHHCFLKRWRIFCQQSIGHLVGLISSSSIDS